MTLKKNTVTYGLSIVGCVVVAGFSLGAAAQTATDLQCNGCVGEDDLRTFAITTSKIRKGAVTEGKLAPGLRAQLDELKSPGKKIVYLDGRDEEIPLRQYTRFIFGPIGAVLSLDDGVVLEVDIGQWCGNSEEPKWCMRPEAETHVTEIFYTGFNCTGQGYVVPDPNLQNGFIPPIAFGRMETNRNIQIFSTGQPGSELISTGSYSTGGVALGNERQRPQRVECINSPGSLGGENDPYYPVTFQTTYSYVLPIRAEFVAEIED